MSDLRKAAQAALEWIESGSGIDFYPTDVLVGLRAALAQPDQPPPGFWKKTDREVCSELVQPTADGWITSPDGLSRRLAAPDAAVGLPVTGTATQTVQFQPTADGPTREDGQTIPSATTSDRGLPEPVAWLHKEPGPHAAIFVEAADYERPCEHCTPLYTADQMLAFRAEGVKEERERCATLVETHDAGGSSFRVRMVLADAIRKG